MLKTKARAHNCVVREQAVVDRCGVQWSCCCKLLVREGNTESTRIVFAHLRIGVFQRCKVAVAGHVHAPNVCAWVAVHHPVGKRKPNASTLRQAGHNCTSRPHSSHAFDWPHERVAVWRECERAVDELLNSCTSHGGEVCKAALELWSNALQIVWQQLEYEIPWCFFGCPRAIVLFVGSKQDALSLLASVDFARKVDHVWKLATGFFVVRDYFFHRLGHQVVVFHCQHWQFNTAHAAHFTRPQATCVHNMLCVNGVVFVGNDVPCSV
ncbi:unannotated protein [freshwater metagenome]|uniref:Unannotated protein n=1 Tax=freshwater metagenome TaxID=449393 RepID=A0A6J6KVY5_9ZZZZ